MGNGSCHIFVGRLPVAIFRNGRLEACPTKEPPEALKRLFICCCGTFYSDALLQRQNASHAEMDAAYFGFHFVELIEQPNQPAFANLALRFAQAGEQFFLQEEWSNALPAGRPLSGGSFRRSGPG